MTDMERWYVKNATYLWELMANMGLIWRMAMRRYSAIGMIDSDL